MAFLPQVGVAKLLGELAVDRGKEIACLRALALAIECGAQRPSMIRRDGRGSPSGTPAED